MAFELFVPRLGWDMEEGTFTGWLKKDGETVKEGEPVFLVESEKAEQEVESLESGILRIPADGPQPGDVLPVGTLIGYLVEPGEEAPSSVKSVAAAPPMPGSAGTKAAPGSTGAAAVPTPAAQPREERDPAARASISPRAKRLAKELGVDWKKVRGTGREGRIVESDIRAAASGAAAASEARPAPVGRLRKRIAERVSESAHSTAPVTLTTEADATKLVSRRDELKASVSGGAVAPTYTDLLVKLTATALEKHSLLNAYWENEQIRVLDDIHIALAVDTEEGLLAPVLRDANKKSIEQIAEESRSLAETARARKLDRDSLQGGTFTITNLGTYGIDAFTPIINLPQCAILGVGAIRLKPAVYEGQLAARHMVSLSLTFDHRIVDGAPAAAFLKTVRELIEQPDL
jgi:pyruvate dehydrogenase E2 component (dihydrolipoamide acetyltransferase)